MHSSAIELTTFSILIYTNRVKNDIEKIHCILTRYYYGRVVLVGVIVYIFAGGARRNPLGNNNGGLSANQSRISFETLTSDGSPAQGDPSASITLVDLVISNANFAQDLQRKQSLRSIRITSKPARSI